MNTIRNGVYLAALAAIGSGFIAGNAKADDWSFSLGGQGRWVEPVYANRPRTLVVPAQYEERTRQVWREPVYEERRTLVQIPPRTEVREMPRYVHGRFAGYDRQVVVVESGRQEWRTQRVLIQPGRWETVVDRILIQPEQSETVYEPVMISAGYWESAPGLSFGYIDHHDDDDDDDRRRVLIGPRGNVRVRR